MIVETYKGCKIRLTKGREYYSTHVVLNGVNQGDSMGTPEKVLADIKTTIDYAEQTGPAEARFGPEWYTPGTYELCPEGHVMPVGGRCGHSWCASQRGSQVKAEYDKVWNDVEAKRRGTSTSAWHALVAAAENASEPDMHLVENTEDWYRSVLSGFEILIAQYDPSWGDPYSRNIDDDRLNKTGAFAQPSVDEYNALSRRLGATETRAANPVFLDAVDAAWKSSLTPGSEDWCRHALNVYAVLTSEPVHLWGELRDEAPIRTRCGLVLPVILTHDLDRVTCPKCAQAFAAAIAANEPAPYRKGDRIKSTGVYRNGELGTVHCDQTPDCSYVAVRFDKSYGPQSVPVENLALHTA